MLRVPQRLVEYSLLALVSAGLTAVVVPVLSRGSSAAQPASGSESASPPARTERAQLSLETILELVSPRDLGVASWRPGEYAEYELRPLEREDAATPELARTVRLQVLRRVQDTDRYVELHGRAEDEMWWLRLQSIRTFRGRHVDTYRLMGLDTSSLGEQTPRFALHESYFPFQETMSLPLPGVRIRSAGFEDLEVEGRVLDCERTEIALEDPSSPDGWYLAATISSHPSAGPFGLVRVRTPQAEVALRSSGVDEELEFDASIRPLVDGRSSLSFLCESCHAEPNHELVDPPR